MNIWCSSECTAITYLFYDSCAMLILQPLQLQYLMTLVKELIWFLVLVLVFGFGFWFCVVFLVA